MTQTLGQKPIRANEANHQVKKECTKSVASLYSSSRLSKLKMKGAIPFTTDTDAKAKFLRTSLTKGMKCLSNEA